MSTQAQEEKLTEYSFSEIFQMIEEETDTVFELYNAVILYNPETDSAFAYKPSDIFSLLSEDKPEKPNPNFIVDKHIFFKNVVLPNNFGFDEVTIGVFKNIHFKKSLSFIDVTGCLIFNSIIDGHFSTEITKNNSKPLDAHNYKTYVLFNNVLNKGLSHIDFSTDDSNYPEFQILMRWNDFYGDEENLPLRISIDQNVTPNIDFVHNNIFGKTYNLISIINAVRIEIRDNKFNDNTSVLAIDFEDEDIMSISIKDNFYEQYVVLNTNEIIPSIEIEWEQFSQKLIAGNGVNSYIFKFMQEKITTMAEAIAFRKEQYSDKYLLPYLDSLRISKKSYFKSEQTQLGVLLSHYRSKFDKENANAVYAEMKDLETKRLEYLYHSNPSFDNYFSWKINQFLKTFSLYGTKPSRSVTYSIYVIFFFALVYLFFPNSWDEQGRNRIINRYTFFMKYMNKKAGIHEVYLEHNQPQILEYSAFKSMIENSDKKVPKFFTATALPLYKWAVSGTKINAKLLKRIDVLKGTWSALPANKRFWKAFLLILIFTIGIAYDLIIKMLNALMLSINTFTTLGFGEIPIKGLPRYLAIIQGFVGWFMLTIFSVALISQLME